MHIVPAEYRVSAMSYGWMFFWIIGGNSTLLSPIIGSDGEIDRDGTGLQRSLAYLYLGGMGMAAVFFILSAVLLHRRNQSERYHALQPESDEVAAGFTPQKEVLFDSTDETDVYASDRRQTDASEGTGDPDTKNQNSDPNREHQKLTAVV